MISPNMVPVGAGEEFVPPTPTPVPNIANLTEEEIVQGLDASLVALLADADPAQGQQLATANGCLGCHMLDPNQTTVAPSWYNVANAALIHAAAEEGPAAYIYHSIIAPNDYVVAGYNAGVMPQTYVDTLNDEQLMNIVSYLLTLRGDETQ
ncbi:MAG: cytochrome c [Caldilineaceae bacterium]|nr:cytochrome c [Caldilineaceae bacterium]